MKKLLLVIVCILMLSGCKSVKLDNGENAIVTFNKGGISAQDLYDNLKENYGADKIIELVDKFLLDKLYESSSEEKKYIKEMVASAEEAAKGYNVDLETYITYYYGVSTEKAFRELNSLNYKRGLWVQDYAEETVSDKQIEEYYETETVGDMTLSHILITSTAKSDASEEEKKEAETKAYEKAKEVIAELKSGKDFSELAKKYSDDEDTKNDGGSLGKVTASGDFSDEIIESAKKLEIGSYSETPVKSTSGYHIIYKTAQDEKPKLDDDLKKEIRETVGLEMTEEAGFESKALLALREKYEMKFEDTDLENGYNKKVGK